MCEGREREKDTEREREREREDLLGEHGIDVTMARGGQVR